MTAELRMATLDDAEALAELGRRTFVETFVEGFAVPYPPEDLEAYFADSHSVEASRERLADPDQRTWVAVRGGELVAFARAGGCALPHPEAHPSHAELKSLYVAREVQGQGLGRALFERALAFMEATTSGPMWIGVWSQNDKAVRFYGHYGFVKAGEYEYPVGRWRDLEHILRRP